MANTHRFLLPTLGLLLFSAGVWVGKGTNKTEDMHFILPNPFYIQGDPELLPLPGQGEQPGIGMVPEECIYLFEDGQLYRMLPGQGQPGQGDGSPELLPLEPVPNVPNLPIPQRTPPQGLDS